MPADFDELSEAEKEHFYNSQQCGEMVDMRQLDDVLSRRSCSKVGYSIRLKRNLNSYTFPNARTLRSQLPNHQYCKKTKTKSTRNPPREESLEIQKAEKIPETLKPIYKMSGTYLGFISNGFLFSRDGDYLGWIEGQYVWDAAGRFRGELWEGKYIIFHPFLVQPLPKQPRAKPVVPALPNPLPNIPPVAPPTGWVAGF